MLELHDPMSLYSDSYIKNLSIIIRKATSKSKFTDIYDYILVINILPQINMVPHLKKEIGNAFERSVEANAAFFRLHTAFSSLVFQS